jgi:ubiquitin-protein ligase
MDTMSLIERIDDVFDYCNNNQNITVLDSTPDDDYIVVRLHYMDVIFELLVTEKDIFIKCDNRDIQKLNVNILSMKKVNFEDVLNLIISKIDIDKPIVNKYNYFNDFDTDIWETNMNNYRLKDSDIRKTMNINTKSLFNSRQIFNLVINEFRNCMVSNSNWSIKPIDDNIYETHVTYNVLESSKHFSHNFNGFEFVMLINPSLFPFIPPELKLISPKINNELSLNLHNLEFLRLDSWNPSTSLQFIFDTLEYVFENYANIISYENTVTKLDEILISLQQTINGIPDFIKCMKIDYNKIQNSKSWKSLKDSKSWKSGLGYGNDDMCEWNIDEYIKTQNLMTTTFSNSIKELINNIDAGTKNQINNSCTYLIINSRLTGLSLIELDKCSDMYLNIFRLIEKMIEFDYPISCFYKSIKHINVLTSNIDDNLELYRLINKVSNDMDKYKCVDVHEIVENEFVTLMKKSQFSSYKYTDNETKLNKTSTIRIMKEYSDLKINLPLHEESSIWFVTDESDVSVFKFLISGPKGTPYENGLFLFNGSIHFNYPNQPPKILFETTGGNSFRFNPNLYDNGFVCLSLLGTWEGKGGEKWNKDTSTLLQILISIQSSIFCDNPYFNEPGHEKHMCDEKTKNISFDYDDNIRLHTLKLAVRDCLIEPPKGFENVVEKFFKFKKADIITQVDEWLNLSKKRKSEFEKIKQEIRNIL